MTKFGDQVFQFGGAPVSSGRYEAWWGSKIRFVDYDYGVSGGTGSKPTEAGKYFQDAIDASNPWDVIYLRPRNPRYSTSGGQYWHLPVSTSNWSIPYTAYGLSLIGTGTGRGTNVMSTTLKGGAVTTDAPVLLIKSCWNSVENLAFESGASDQAQIKSLGATAATNMAYGNTYNNCIFVGGDDLAADNLQGCIHIDSSGYEGIYNCTFKSSPVGIVLRSSLRAVGGTQIHGCDFQGTAAEVQCDICSTGATLTNISIKDCTFEHAVPSKTVYAGALNRYVYFGGTSTGLVSDCSTGAATAIIATNMTLDGVLYSNLWGDGVGPMTDA